MDTELPLRIRGYSVVEGGVLVIAMNLTARSEDDVNRSREVNTLVTSGYGQAVAHHDNGNIGGKIPTRLRIAEVNNTGVPPRISYVNTLIIREYYTNQIDSVEFTERVWDTARNMTGEEMNFTRNLDRDAGNVTIRPKYAD
ncbi:hypothetical protein [Halosimplex salinum]|uniref:hypothetical protein n=1 Tax=Halosimplex salinum TaxID=1710538 RepID=UPI0013DE1363|nr:hypothetical protein [Halosimplex salinum]